MSCQRIATVWRIAASAALMPVAVASSSSWAAAEEEGWSLSVCGTTNADGSLVGSWSGTGASKQAAVDDMRDTAPSGLTASGPCFAFDNLSESQAREGQEKVRGKLNAKLPATVWTELTGKEAPAELRR
ncbi:hypothetical protein [Segniliparus rugosus]|uniref:Uncharacterized protein n=1 Tax=Segniliparus rugosus (strain ATCC BAA-974 / DSM 45345 / CCUG 50838 / CIP 108380 / JCM 13579 / CDC 945) TaxID=679197 RepID=E5XRL2_SEGRC|nr:hypothetical protein [Segniliparus rugosus]EFV12975.2 hypothetical protein HMPREF9336_02134 [Segniliparus rugosus ATCC BAA-974]